MKMLTLQTGDIEVVESKLQTITRVTDCEKCVRSDGGVQDTVIATIPKSKRELVANFILNA